MAVKNSKSQTGLRAAHVLFNINSNNPALEVVCLPKYNCIGDTKNWEVRGVFRKDVRIKMVTLISDSNKAFDPFVGNAKPYNTGTRDMWVTAFPQVRDFCKGVKDMSKKFRLEQYLGLTPHTNKARFVTLFVKPIDIFRPCRDKEIFDNFCSQEFGPGATPEYKRWMDKTYESTFPAGGIGVPWTRMGYTYDWGNFKDPIGASEYVINPNSEVYVESITPIEEYCR
jgi:hypothetical protein